MSYVSEPVFRAQYG